MYTLVTGDTILILQTLKVGAAALDVSGTTITSRLIAMNGGEALTDEITNSAVTVGADWTNGIVAIIIPGSLTESINPVLHPQVLLETQVNDGTYDKTWFSTVDVAKGTI